MLCNILFRIEPVLAGSDALFLRAKRTAKLGLPYGFRPADCDR